MLGLLWALSGCSRGPSVQVPSGTPVVLISIDTLRSDRLPAYGYTAVATPTIDALRRDGILFERAYSHVPLTLPAHVSLLCGRLPGEHGVRDNMGYAVDPAKNPMLQRSLRDLGYATGAFVSAYVLRGSSGLADGFDVYEDGIEVGREIGLGSLQRPGGETLGLALEWLRSVKSKPFFVFFHIYEPHAPYAAPEPFRSRYAASPYDGEVAASDAVVGGLLDELRRLGLYERSLVLLLSDHGEGLGDHGEDEHGIFLYRSTLQVPLLLKLPAGQRAGATIREPAQLVDVAPTILSLLGQRVPEEGAGTSLLDLDGSRKRPRAIYSETFYPRLHFGWSDLASLIQGDEHWIEAPEPELYDLSRDPGEERNLATGQHTKVSDLRDALERFRVPLEAPSEVDEETRRNLAALGYIGTVGSVLHGDLPDPKSQREALRDIREAFRLYTARDHSGAIPALRKVLAANPRMLDAWEALGRSLDGAGRPAEALEAYQEALRLSGGAPPFALSAATLLLRLGRYDEAVSHAQIALAGHLSAANDVLAQAALRSKRLDDAERYARAAVAQRGTRLAPLVILGEVLFAEGRGNEALTVTDQVQEEFNRRKNRDLSILKGVCLLRGKIFAARGEAERALAAFEQEIQLFPDQLAAYSHLAVFYGIVGRPEEVRSTLQRMIAANPGAPAYAEAVRTLRVLKDETSAARLLEEAKRRFPGDPRLEKGV